MPPVRDWKIWRRLLVQAFNMMNYDLHRPLLLPSPLGSWIHPPTRSWLWSPSDSKLVQVDTWNEDQSINGWVYYPQNRARSDRIHYTHSHYEYNIATRLQCAGVEVIDGLNVYFTGSCSIAIPTVEPPSFESYLSTINTNTTWAIGNPDWSLLHLLLPALSSGTLIGVANGSFKDGIGSATWVITTLQDPSIWIVGTHLTPGNSGVQCAYRSKVGGIYGLLVVIDAITHFYH